MPRLAGRAEAEAQMSPCEKAMTLADYATHPAEGTPLLEQYATGLAAPLTWIDVLPRERYVTRRPSNGWLFWPINSGSPRLR